MPAVSSKDIHAVCNGRDLVTLQSLFFHLCTLLGNKNVLLYVKILCNFNVMFFKKCLVKWNRFSNFSTGVQSPLVMSWSEILRKEVISPVTCFFSCNWFLCSVLRMNKSLFICDLRSPCSYSTVSTAAGVPVLLEMNFRPLHISMSFEAICLFSRP